MDMVRQEMGAAGFEYLNSGGGVYGYELVLANGHEAFWITDGVGWCEGTDPQAPVWTWHYFDQYDQHGEAVESGWGHTLPQAVQAVCDIVDGLDAPWAVKLALREAIENLREEQA